MLPYIYIYMVTLILHMRLGTAGKTEHWLGQDLFFRYSWPGDNIPCHPGLCYVVLQTSSNVTMFTHVGATLHDAEIREVFHDDETSFRQRGINLA